MSEYMAFLQGNSGQIAQWPRWKRQLAVEAGWMSHLSPEEQQAFVAGKQPMIGNYNGRKTWYYICEKCDLISTPGLRYCFLHAGRVDPFNRCDYAYCPNDRSADILTAYCDAHHEVWERYLFDREAMKWLHWLVWEDTNLDGKI